MEVWEAVKRGKDALDKAGVESPLLEAQLLLMKATGLTKVELYTRDSQKLTQKEKSEFECLVDKRSSGYPLQYITGVQDFMGLELMVNENVLIPRSDTELLVEQVLELVKDLGEKKELYIADICTGSGAIAISIAVHTSQAIVYATDVSNGALDVAKKNAAKFNVSDRVRLMQGDLLNPVAQLISEERLGLLDLIVSNPPYISKEGFAEVEPSVLEYEPRIALAGGDDGLDFYRRLAKEGSCLLRPGGYIIVEIGYDQRVQVEEIFQSEKTLQQVLSVKDYQGKDRIILGKKA